MDLPCLSGYHNLTLSRRQLTVVGVNTISLRQHKSFFSGMGKNPKPDHFIPALICSAMLLSQLEYCAGTKHALYEKVVVCCLVCKPV